MFVNLPKSSVHALRIPGRQRLLWGVVLCGDGVFRRAMWPELETGLWSG